MFCCLEYIKAPTVWKKSQGCGFFFLQSLELTNRRAQCYSKYTDGATPNNTQGSTADIEILT